MKKQIFRPTVFTAARAYALPLLFLLAAVALLSLGLKQTESANRREGLNMLREGLLRASVKCYAAEGKYPGDLSYIEENYGIYIDRELYDVHYDMFASNILPNITVIEKQ